MSRYIDAEKLIDDIRPFAEYDSNRSNKDWVRRFEIAIDAQPTADVRENVRGEWLSLMGHQVCSICGYKNDIVPTNFCPNCGADMRQGSTDRDMDAYYEAMDIEQEMQER